MLSVTANVVVGSSEFRPETDVRVGSYDVAGSVMSAPVLGSTGGVVIHGATRRLESRGAVVGGFVARGGGIVGGAVICEKTVDVTGVGTVVGTVVM